MEENAFQNDFVLSFLHSSSLTLLASAFLLPPLFPQTQKQIGLRRKLARTGTDLTDQLCL